MPATMSTSKEHNLSYRGPIEMIQKALESRILEISKHIWHYMVDTKFEGENLPESAKMNIVSTCSKAS